MLSLIHLCGKQIADKAAEYLGTKFVHQGRLKGVGVDCIGLLVCIARELKLEHYDYLHYSERPDPAELLHYIHKSCDRVLGDAIPGDIYLFWFVSSDRPQHAGIVVQDGFIHTYKSIGKVVKHPLTAAWRKRLYGIYRYRWQH